MFALIIGTCTIVPPSAKAALLMVMLLYGVGSSAPDYDKRMEFQIAEQYVAGGKTPEAAIGEVKHLNQCFSTWRMK